MKKYLLWLLYIVFVNVILFVTCALPWYGTMITSSWYAALAIPGTALGSLICYEFFCELRNWDDEDDNTPNEYTIS